MFVIQENISLKPYNTFGIDVKAHFFAEIFSEKDLLELMSDPIFSAHKILVLGGGSNLLFTEDFNGLVIKVSIKGIESDIFGDSVLVTAGAEKFGTTWLNLVYSRLLRAWKT